MIENNYPYFNQEHYTPEEAIKILSEAQIYNNLKKAIKRYGLERTEDIIKINYDTVPKLKEKMLKILYEIWKG